MAKHLVVDSGGFIRNAPIRDIGEEVYSISEVVNEISDKATKQRLQVLPYTLNMKRPSAEAVVFVSDFAKKTGDYRHLSSTDINVLALTYMLEKQHVGDEHIRKEPLKKAAEYIVPTKTTPSQQMAGFYLGRNTDNADKQTDEPEPTADDSGLPETTTEEKDTEVDDRPQITADAASLPEVSREEREVVTEDSPQPAEDGADGQETLSEKEKEEEVIVDRQETLGDDAVLPEELLEEEEEVMEDEEDDDDDEGWITPSNISSVKRQMGIGSPAAEKTRVGVACLTTDFAMQNVLIQMGLNVVSVDGMLIKQARSYVMRCFACMKITYDTMKVFCPVCGNKTLKRVAMMRDEDGQVRYFFSRRPLNTRGMKYPLPTPKGGKHANNPVLFEDQPIPQQRPRKTKKAVDVFDPDYIAGSSPFAIHDVSSRAATIGISGKHDFRNTAYWNKRNPNEPRKQHGRRK